MKTRITEHTARRILDNANAEVASRKPSRRTWNLLRALNFCRTGQADTDAHLDATRDEFRAFANAA